MSSTPLCPECGGLVEVTLSFAVICRQYGSDHLRVEWPEADQWLIDNEPGSGLAPVDEASTPTIP
jgi:hypothetical protein